MWIPEDAESDPVPAVLEYIPYRRRDFTAIRDATKHAYYAGHGYASLRVDMRGTGDSDGLMLDEYTQGELDDAVEVIAWLAAQPWCTGTVGMTGISWGGFNALQVAALRPPALKAIITACSTDDRYADDIHYMGGCLITENMSWASTMFAFNSRPPDPTVVGDRWREMWMERLAHGDPWIIPWLEHAHRDAQWKHGSVCEDFSAIECAVYAVGGWADGYSNAIPRLLEGLSCPRRGLVGPWPHAWPNACIPGPCIGFEQDALRWWDQYLKGIDTGIADEPMYRVWMQEGVPPKPAVRGAAGALGGGGELAFASHREPAPRPQRGRDRGGGGSGRGARSPLAAARRPLRGRVVPLRVRGGDAARSASRGRAVAVFRFRRAARGARDPRRAGGRARARRGPPECPRGRAPQRCRARGSRHPGDLRASEPHSPFEPRAPARRWSRGAATACACR